MSSIYQLSTYSLATISNQVAASSSTPTMIWSVSIPAGAKGRNAILQLFFNLYCSTTFFANQSFYYGIYVDGVPLAIGDSTTMKYVHTAATPYAISAAGVGLGTNPLFGYQPLVIPLAIAAGASQIQIGITNSSLALSTTSSSTPHVTSNVTVSSGTLNTGNYIPVNTFTATGSATYTVPTTVQGGSVVGVYIYLWGAGGNQYSSVAGGPGGYTSGFYSCTGGTNLTYVVGAVGSGNTASGGGGTGQSYGGGFSGVFSSSSLSQATAIAIAGGGGGASTGLASSGGAGGGSNGTAPYYYSGGNTGTYVTGSQVGGSAGPMYGSQSAAGYGLVNGGVLSGGSTFANNSGGGGGGYYGGGGSGNATSGGGGSGYTGGLTSQGFTVAGNQVLSAIATGTGSNVTAGGPYSATNGLYTASNSPYYPSGGTYGSGGGGTGLVVIVPAIGSTAVQVGVSASLYAL